MATITTTKTATIEIEMDAPVTASLLLHVLSVVPPEAVFVHGVRTKNPEKIKFTFARPDEVQQLAV